MSEVQKKFHRCESQCPRFSIKILKVRIRLKKKKSDICHPSFGNVWYYLKSLPEYGHFCSSRRKSVLLLEVRYWYQYYTGSDTNTVTLVVVMLGCSH